MCKKMPWIYSLIFLSDLLQQGKACFIFIFMVQYIQMKYQRMSIEKESPEELGYGNIKYNLAESSVSDVMLKNIQLNLADLSLCYTHHRGHPLLRELISLDGNQLDKDDILTTVGAASALFIIATTLLTSGDHLIVIKPNYATNIETPKAIGCEITYINILFEHSWKLDIGFIEKAIQPNTKYISVTHPHNPTGTVLEENELYQLAEMAERHHIYLLVDETYRDLNFEKLLPYAASLNKHVISVSSVSKSYGLPGLRLGWLVTKDKDLMEQFLAAKEQIFISNSVLDEEVALQFLLKKQEYFKEITEAVQKKFAVLEQWITNEQRLEWIKPCGGVVCFPRIKDELKINTVKFYHLLMNKHATMVGPGHWFDMPGNFMRIGYGWPTLAELEKGLQNISSVLSEVQAI